MKKFFMKTLALAMMLMMSAGAWAQTEKFNASTASILSTYFATYGWAADGETSATYDATTGTITVDIALGKEAQWQCQVGFGHDIDFNAGKYYQMSCTMHATAACNQVTIKVDDNTGMILANQNVNIPANQDYTYTSDIVQGVAGNNHKIVFDFGYAAAGTTVTISNISIVETETAPEPTAFNGCGDTFVASSGNAANGHDSNLGTRWESNTSDPQYWQWNMAEAQTFNRIKIVWEGAYGKTFNIKAGMACDNLTTIASVENQVLNGFPYTQIIELAEPVTASSIQFEGLARGTGYGYSFWEFDVYEAQASVLSSFELTAAAEVCAVGANVALTATPKDQYNSPMEGQTITYEVQPATAGHVTNGVYYADAAGTATIIASCASYSDLVDIYNYAGENVALNKTVTGEAFNALSRVNDGNDGTELQCDPNNGGAGLDVTCGFTIDLGARYDLSLVTIKFEGACSDAYTLETSVDNIGFDMAHSFSGTLGINGHTDMLYGANLNNANGVRYLKFTSTKSSTQWGMKIFELRAFGVESQIELDPVESIALDRTAATIEVGQQLTLAGTILPATADQRIQWSVAPADIVTVANGVVTAIATGTAVVTATAVGDNTKTASCTVTVVPSTAKTYYGCGYDAVNEIVAAYTITWAESSVSYRIVPQHSKEGFVCQVNDGNWNTAVKNEGIYEYTSTNEYTTGDAINGFLYMPFAGGAGRVDFNYTVGAESAPYTRAVASVYGTLALPFNASVEGAQLYTIAGVRKNGDVITAVVLEEVEDNIALAGRGYIFEPNADELVATYTAIAPFSANEGLVGNIAAEMSLSAADSEDYYVLSNNRIVHLAGDATATIGLNRAYISLADVEEIPANVAGRTIAVAADEATGLMNHATMDEVEKQIINGRIFILRGGNMYDLNGRIVK